MKEVEEAQDEMLGQGKTSKTKGYGLGLCIQSKAQGVALVHFRYSWGLSLALH